MRSQAGQLVTRRLRVGLDGTPLLGTRTGVGQYVAALVERLARDAGLELRATPFTVRTGGRPSLPAAVGWRHLPVPARAARWSWARGGPPPVELVGGRVDVFHGTNFVLPPTLRAAGVLTVHDLAYLRHADTVSATSAAYRDLVPRGLRRAAVVLTPSRTVAAELADAYPFAADRIRATPLGVDAAWARAQPLDAADRARLGVPADYLLFVGTREPRKNLPVLLQAHRRAAGDDPDGVPPLVLAGPAGWGDIDPAEAADPGDVVRCGFLPGEVLRSLVAGATALVLPSRYEGFGLPVLEALACGVPVVCSDLPVLLEVGGDQCRYVPVGDVDALATALLEVAGRRPDGGQPARRAWAARFTWQACADLTAAAYRDAAGTRASRQISL